MWAKFVVGSFSAPRGFPPGTPVFPSSQKPALLNSNSTRNALETGSGDWATTPRVIEPTQLNLTLLVTRPDHYFKSISLVNRWVKKDFF